MLVNHDRILVGIRTFASLSARQSGFDSRLVRHVLDKRLWSPNIP